LNIGDIVSGPVGHLNHHGQGIAAIFAVTFDLRVRFFLTMLSVRLDTLFHGNDLRVLPKICAALLLGQDISGVEFKSMPSGLHNVNEDLVSVQQVSLLILDIL
jgi:hypothetical protein